MNSRPRSIHLKIEYWWVKPLAMLQHNWAVVDDSAHPVTVYFFHDDGTTKKPSGYAFKSKDNEKFIAIVDSLTFMDRRNAEEALALNGFSKITSDDHPFAPYRPIGTVFDARLTEPGVYSKEGFWRDAHT